MPSIDFAKIRSLFTMAQVLERMEFVAGEGSPLGQVRGPCLLHGSSPGSRSFSADLANHRFQCFKCGAKGNHLDLWAAVSGQSIYDAALDWCRFLKIEVPQRLSVAPRPGRAEQK